jgi:insertion element IS1 protein InsB
MPQKFLILSRLKLELKMNETLLCFYCGSANIIKYGRAHYKKPKCKCKDCNRQFVCTRTYPCLTNEQKMLIGDLLLERISLEGIIRVLKISAYQLYKYMDELYDETPKDLFVNELLSGTQDIDLQCFECENDEAWSFVFDKSNKQWIWIAMHRQTRMIIGLFIGSRGTDGALGLWNSIPDNIRENAIYHTDDWDAYKKVFDKAKHIPSKIKKETNHIERFWNTLRQRCSRLVRETLSFSKIQKRHEAAIRYFAACYNLSLPLPF